jgi:hypothetical protein
MSTGLLYDFGVAGAYGVEHGLVLSGSPADGSAAAGGGPVGAVCVRAGRNATHHPELFLPGSRIILS